MSKAPVPSGTLGRLADDAVGAVGDVGDAALGGHHVGKALGQSEQGAGRGFQRREQAARVLGDAPGAPGAGHRGCGGGHLEPAGGGDEAGAGEGAAAEELTAGHGHGSSLWSVDHSRTS